MFKHNPTHGIIGFYFKLKIIFDILNIMKADAEIVNKIKLTTFEFLPNSEILLFGSRARDESVNESDYDLLIVTTNSLSPRSKMPFRTSIRKALLNQGIRTDVLIQSRSEIDQKKQIPGHIIRNIMSEAVSL